MHQFIINHSLFLSTLSLRRATTVDSCSVCSCNISIHALLAESDTGGQSCNSTLVHFYPRSPCGERRKIRPVAPDISSISIHALLAESDSLCMLYDTTSLIFLSTLSLRRATVLGRKRIRPQRYFYPRSPCGERPSKLAKTSWTENISIHALLAESD